MSRLVRIVLLLVLAVALPAQGIAAATMAMCGMQSEDDLGLSVGSVPHDDAAPTPTQQQGDGLRHAHPDASVSGHSHASEHSDAGDANAQSDTDASGQHGLHKCSVCAACCVGVAFPARTFTFEPVALTDSVASPAVRCIAAVVPKGLERPPRVILA